MANERFVKIYSQGNGFTSAQLAVYLDKETGVNYAFFRDGYGGGLTVLLDKEGKPIVTPTQNK